MISHGSFEFLHILHPGHWLCFLFVCCLFFLILLYSKQLWKIDIMFPLEDRSYLFATQYNTENVSIQSIIKGSGLSMEFFSCKANPLHAQQLPGHLHFNCLGPLSRRSGKHWAPFALSQDSCKFHQHLWNCGKLTCCLASNVKFPKFLHSLT